MGGDFLDGCRFAKAGNIGVVGGAALPFVEGAGNFFQILRGERAQNAVDHVPELASVDEEGLAGAIEVFRRRRLLALREEPDAGGNLGVREELTRKRDHALDEVGLNEGAADVALAAGAAAHGAIGEEERHAALRGEVVEHVLDPGEVRVAPRRGAVAPARVALEFASHHSLMLKGGLAIT